jgi:hypothetical protein
LGGLSGVVDEDVRIGGHTRNGTDHVTANKISWLGNNMQQWFPGQSAYSFNV